MKKFRSEMMQTAYNKGGFRERYAMKNGTKVVTMVNGCKCFKFTYATDKEYQDANGATFNTVTRSWID